MFNYRWQITLVLVGVIFVAGGVLISRNGFNKQNEIEIIEDENTPTDDLTIEVSGAVNNPGVYRLSADSRIDDALNAAGGINEEADTDWIAKTINRAAKITDGQKIYIASINEQSNVLSANNSGEDQTISEQNSANFQQKVNINTASQNELESLWGIGPVTAQNIIEQRPYSNVEELLQKGILKTNVYERNKNLLSVY